MSDNNSQDIKLPPEDIKENKFIIQCIENYENEVLKKPLNILIWGPAKPSDNSDKYKVDTYKKRVEIKEHLKKLGHNALFSEDISKETEKRKGYKPNPQAYEKIQIGLADLAIMLRVSPGTIAEFHDFHDDPNYARKMCVYFDKEHKESYTHTGADCNFVNQGGKLEEFSYPDDINKCFLLCKIADHIKQVQAAILLSPYKKY